MSASLPARRLSLCLPLLAVASLGLVGCSSTAELDGPVTGHVDGGAYEGGDEDEGEEGSSTGEGGGPDDGQTGDGPSEPDPVPDDEGRGVPSKEPDQECDAQTDVALWLAPEDSNGMTSPVRAREAALGGWASVQSVAIRTWEFFNYYDFGYPEAPEGTLALHPALRQPAGAGPGEYVMQVGVSSPALSNEARAPMNLTLVLDTSGSMDAHAMEMLEQTCYAIAASLRAGDVVSVVTWSASNAVVLAGYEVEGPDDPLLLQRIDGLVASGASDLHTGLQAGYALAQQSFALDRINRVVLVSDGGANAALDDVELIAMHAASDHAGIYLVGVGVGDAATYRDDLIDTTTHAGKGASVFVGSAEDAWSTFHDDFVATMAVAARNVQLRLDLPPGYELVSTAGNPTSFDASPFEPQHLAPNDALVFHHRIRTCAPELVTSNATITATVIWIDPATLLPRQLQRVSTVGELLAADPAPLLKGVAVHTYAESLKVYKRSDAEGRVQTMAKAFETLAQAEAAQPGDPQLAEIRQVLEALLE
jgi:Ca-activated chloride channel homolog